MSEKAKINLDLLKKLVSELDKSLATAYGIKPKEEMMEFITELARASGLAAVVMQEAHMLVKDIYALTHMYQGAPPPAEADIMSELEKALGSSFPKRNPN